MSRAILDAPTIAPVASRIGDTVTPARACHFSGVVWSRSARPPRRDGCAPVRRPLPHGDRQGANGLAEHLMLRVPEYALGRLIPRSDDPLEIFTDNRVVARLHDGGELVRVAFEL